MPITVDKLSDEPIIVSTFTEPINYDTDLSEMFSKILEFRDKIENSPKYYAVMDISRIKPGFSDIVLSLGEVRKVSKKRRADIPINLHLVGDGDFFSILAKAMTQTQYGNYTARFHSSLSKALDIIRAEISADKANS